MQTVLRFPGPGPAESPATRLADILHESSYLLQASRDSEDPEVREAAIDLAVRSLKAAATALAPKEPKVHPVPPGRILHGPWAAAAAQSSKS